MTGMQNIGGEGVNLLTWAMPAPEQARSPGGTNEMMAQSTWASGRVDRECATFPTPQRWRG